METKYKDSNLPIEQRIADLISLMTVEEKIGQLNQLLGWKAYTRDRGNIGVSDEFRKKLSGSGIGSLYGVLRADPWTQVTLETGLSPGEGAQATNAIQRFVIENTRLGIPIMFGEECSHGHMAIGGTVFPVPINMASTWNTKALRKMAAAIALETRAQGGAATYSPVVDVCRDPRWGRTEETWGEDPYYISRMAEAAVQGLQGESIGSDRNIIATIKHFGAYGNSEGGHNAAPARSGPRELREVHFAPFEAGIKAGAESLMSSYNEIDGVPCTGGKQLLTGILRDEWGFQGFVISDMGAVSLIANLYRMAADLAGAGAMALESGVDMEMSAEAYAEPLIKAIHEGRVSEEVLNTAVARVLRAKFRLGLFEKPYVDPKRAQQVIHCPEHIELAREVARQSMVLLKNENHTLPLKKNVKSIAVIGPNAHNVYNQLGDYTAPQAPGKVVTVLEGIKAAVSNDTVVRYAKGCAIRNTSREGFAQAIEAARTSDVAVVVVGGSSARNFGERSFNELTGAAVADPSQSTDMECGEGLDRADLDLSGVQLDLVKAVYETGVPMVVVLINGRPITMNWIAENAPAILEAWYPGEQGGNAVADVLFGDYNPAGRLPISFPKSVGQLPVFYNSTLSPRANYMEMNGAPLYSFGYGLSYTTFGYDNLKITPENNDRG